MKWPWKNTCIIIASVGLSFFIISCAGSKIGIIDDPGDNRTIYRLDGVWVEVNKKYIGDYGCVKLKFDMYVSKTDSDTTVFLQLNTLTQGGLNLQRGDVLELITDGKVEHFLCLESTYGEDSITFRTRYISSEYYLLESGWFQINKQVITDIANSTKTEFSISCQNGGFKGKFRDTNLERVRKYYRMYVMRH